MGDGASNSKLAKRLRRRDPKALRQLVDDNARLLWAVVSGHLPRFAGFTDRDVEECVSDVFVSFAQHPDRYDERRGSPQAYLCALARNRAIDRFRESGFSPEEYFDNGALAELVDAGVRGGVEHAGAPSGRGGAQAGLPGGGPGDEAWHGIGYQALYDAVNELPDPTREVVLRRYFMEQKPAAIAHATGLPKKEVENRLYRAKRTLAKALGKAGLPAAESIDAKEDDGDEHLGE